MILSSLTRLSVPAWFTIKEVYMPLPFYISALIGAVIFGVLYLMHFKHRFIILWHPVVFVAGVATYFLYMTTNFDPNNVYAGIGYMIMLFLAMFFLGGYLLTWLGVFLYDKYKK